MSSDIISFTGSKLDSSDSHITIHAIDPLLFSEFTDIQTSLARGFFITSDIFGSLYETRNSEQYLLVREGELYVISTQHFNILLLRNYIFTLKDDVKRYKKFSAHYQVIIPEDVVQSYSQQIELFQTQCENFNSKYSQEAFGDYYYTQNLKFLISTYAHIRSTLLGNAEALYDTTQSNNFLLLGIEDLDISSYGRVNTWLNQNQEHYMMNLLNFQDKQLYNIALTSSGMKAIDLMIQYIISQKKKKILIVGIIYFEIIKLLENYFDHKDIIFYDLSNGIENIGDYITQHSPDAIFVDSVTLSFEQDIFSKEDFIFLMSQLDKHQSNASIILDVTTKYIHLEDYKIPTHIKNDIFFVGSLVKYFYSGMDLGFGGYVLFPKTATDLWQFIPNTGAGINTTEALKIPILPARHHSNIIKEIHNKISDIKTIITRKKYNSDNISITFPDTSGLNINKDNFFGNLINIDYSNIQDGKNIISEYKEILVQKIITTAKAHNIDLSYSTSYGYTNTRFSVFSCQSVKVIPINHPCYIRISIGYASQVSDIIKLISIIGIILDQLKNK